MEVPRNRGSMPQSPLGVALTPDDGVYVSLGTPTQAAVDPAGNIWVSDAIFSDMVKLTYSPPNFARINPLVNLGGGFDDDVHQIAIDSAGNVYVSDYTDGMIYKLNNQGYPASGYTPSRGFNGVALLSDTTFYAGYPGDEGELSGQEFASDGGLMVTSYTCASYTDTLCGLRGPSAFAVDRVGEVWATNSNSTLGHFSPSASSGIAVSGGGLNFNGGFFETWLAIDGGDHVWVPNSGGRSVSGFDDSGAALSPDPAGFQGPLSCGASGLAIDGSGDVWVSCDADNTPVVEFIGAAVPVYTPLTPGHFGVRP
jgi:hypothetical protein